MGGDRSNSNCLSAMRQTVDGSDATFWYMRHASVLDLHLYACTR